MNILYTQIINHIIFMAAKLKKSINTLDLKFLDYNQLEKIKISLHRELYNN